MKTNIRPPKELLQVFLDNQDIFLTGLCAWAHGMFLEGNITEEEEKYIGCLIQQHPDYNPLLLIWEPYKIQPRIDWLKENLQ
jgi:hypothetical protein